MIGITDLGNNHVFVTKIQSFFAFSVLRHGLHFVLKWWSTSAQFCSMWHDLLPTFTRDSLSLYLQTYINSFNLLCDMCVKQGVQWNKARKQLHYFEHRIFRIVDLIREYNKEYQKVRTSRDHFMCFLRRTTKYLHKLWWLNQTKRMKESYLTKLTCIQNKETE